MDCDYCQGIRPDHVRYAHPTEASGGNWATLHRWLGLGPLQVGIGAEEEAPCEEGPDHGVPKAISDVS